MLYQEADARERKKEKKKCLGYSKTEILITPVMRENLKFHHQPYLCQLMHTLYNRLLN